MVGEKCLCEFHECNNVGMSRGKGGKRDKLCGKHRRLKYGIKSSKRQKERFSVFIETKAPKYYVRRKGRRIYIKDEISLVSKMPCSRCGWNESYCDRHRLIPELGYVKGNVVPLCPNCHRVEHRGKFQK